jgi:hypothetical protein
VLYDELGWEGDWKGRWEISGDGGEGIGGGTLCGIQAEDRGGEAGEDDYRAGERIFAAGDYAQIVED